MLDLLWHWYLISFLEIMGMLYQTQPKIKAGNCHTGNFNFRWTIKTWQRNDSTVKLFSCHSCDKLSGLLHVLPSPGFSYRLFSCRHLKQLTRWWKPDAFPKFNPNGEGFWKFGFDFLLSANLVFLSTGAVRIQRQDENKKRCFGNESAFELNP